MREEQEGRVVEWVCPNHAHLQIDLLQTFLRHHHQVGGTGWKVDRERGQLIVGVAFEQVIAVC